MKAVKLLRKQLIALFLFDVGLVVRQIRTFALLLFLAPLLAMPRFHVINPYGMLGFESAIGVISLPLMIASVIVGQAQERGSLALLLGLPIRRSSLIIMKCFITTGLSSFLWLCAAAGIFISQSLPLNAILFSVLGGLLAIGILSVTATCLTFLFPARSVYSYFWMTLAAIGFVLIKVKTVNSFALSHGVFLGGCIFLLAVALWFFCIYSYSRKPNPL